MLRAAIRALFGQSPEPAANAILMPGATPCRASARRIVIGDRSILHKILMRIGDEHHIVRWKPGYFTHPVDWERSPVIIEIPDGARYRGLCMEDYELHAIFEPVEPAIEQADAA